MLLQLQISQVLGDKDRLLITLRGQLQQAEAACSQVQQQASEAGQALQAERSGAASVALAKVELEAALAAARQRLTEALAEKGLLLQQLQEVRLGARGAEYGKNDSMDAMSLGA